jgi:hypothetical protein
LREFSIIQFSAAIRKEPDWEEKRKGPHKLREEVSRWWDLEIDDECFEYVMEELDYYISLRDGAIQVIGEGGKRWEVRFSLLFYFFLFIRFFLCSFLFFSSFLFFFFFLILFLVVRYLLILLLLTVIID